MSGFGLLGEKLSHSFSPKLHALLGNDAYGLYEVPPEDLGDFLSSAALDGMNVTVPYKKAVLPFCTELSPTAAAIGSVNTLLRRDGGWYGDNTDAFGFAYLLDRCGCDPKGKVCAVLGSGGASVTVQQVLRERGAARISVLSRQGRNDYDHLADYADAQVVVNATPVGMFPDNGKSPVPSGAFPACEFAIDLIYNPLRTAFLQQLQQQTFHDRPVVYENGLAMLTAQAARSAELFSGRTIPPAEIEETLCKLERASEGVALIGMPGCGKTTVGRFLAEKLGRPFVDLDEAITEHTGIRPEQWLRAAGEDVFRAAETETLREVSKRPGIVLACGGGVVMRPENGGLLRQNCRIVWLDRELCKLKTAGRPLSESRGNAALLAQREPLYEAFSELRVRNDGRPGDAVNRILEALK